MRKSAVFFTVFALLFLLCACDGDPAEANTTYTVTHGSREYLIDSQACTIV